MDFRAKFELSLVLQTGEFDYWGPGPIPLATSRLWCKDINLGFVFCSPTTVSVHLGQFSSRSVSPFRSASTSASVHFGQCSSRSVSPFRSASTSVSVHLGQCSPRSVFISVSVRLDQSVSISVSVRLDQCSSRSVSVHLGQCPSRSVFTSVSQYPLQ